MPESRDGEQIDRLMRVDREHWTEHALCRDDPRFTANPADLRFADFQRMADVCDACPVFAQCDQWAAEAKAIEVFAAGRWRIGE